MLFELRNYEKKNECCVLSAFQITLSQAIEYEEWELIIRADN